MLGYDACPVGGTKGVISAESLTCGRPSLPVVTSEGNAECATGTQIWPTDLQPNGVSNIHLMEVLEPAVHDILEVSSDASRKTAAAACLDRHSELALEGKEFLSSKCSPASGNRIGEDARDCSNTRCMLSHCRAYSCSQSDAHVTQLDARNSGVTVLVAGDKFQHDVNPDETYETTNMSAVQSWVDSLSPDMEEDNEYSLHCSEKCVVGCEKHCHQRNRSRLHHHLGYKSPSDLFEKIIFSEDEELRTRTESDSTASSSSSPNTARRSMQVMSSRVHIPLTSGRSQTMYHLDSKNTNCDGRNTHVLLLRLLRRSWKGGCDSQARLKGKIVVNGHTLSSASVKQAEERAGKLCPGSYWYDSTAGFWGVEGGACRGILPASIKEFDYPMLPNCANGDTQIYINGRELNSRDLAVLSPRGLPQKVGRAYTLGIDGVLVDETTGLEVKHLGKLAPTVLRRGKGFGMFAGDVPVATQRAVQGNVIKGGS